MKLRAKLEKPGFNLMAVGTWDCSGDCRSTPQYHLSQTTACNNAQIDVNSGCCSNASCIGCCQQLGGDCVALVGNYMAMCTAAAKSCSGNSTTPVPVSYPWGQCGGIGWTGPTHYVPGYICNPVNANYSQCIPQ
jgi:Fungal cellulose binding domain.